MLTPKEFRILKTTLKIAEETNDAGKTGLVKIDDVMVLLEEFVEEATKRPTVLTRGAQHVVEVPHDK